MQMPDWLAGKRTSASPPPSVERRPGESDEVFEARRSAAEAEMVALVERERRKAYEAGRRDQERADRARRLGWGAGLVGALVLVVALLGTVWLTLAAREGSFAAGGAAMDRAVASVTTPARTAANQAVDRTGLAVQSAGQAIEDKGERIRQSAN